MKLKSLILAFPVLCLACGGPSNDTDPASQADSGPYLAKSVVAVRALTGDTQYGSPSHILGEEFIRDAFHIGEKTELKEISLPTGGEFEWDGNKVAITFGGTKPYESIYNAEYEFNKMYQEHSGHTTEKATLSGPATEGTGAEHSAMGEAKPESGDKIKGDSTAKAAVPLTKPAVSTAHYTAVQGVGDKAVWNEAEGAMHVLYNNHIVTVVVETKDKPEVRKEHAQRLAEVLVDKIAENEYAR